MDTKKKTKKSQKTDELKDLLLRTQANFENYKKQSEKRIDDIRQIASKNIITQILPIIDNFELALKSSNNVADEFYQGIVLIYSQLSKTLEDNGVKIIGETEIFNPHIHEPIMKVPSPKSEGTIIETMQKGYMIHDKVLRAARVKISAGLTKSNPKQKNEINREDN